MTRLWESSWPRGIGLRLARIVAELHPMAEPTVGISRIKSKGPRARTMFAAMLFCACAVMSRLSPAQGDSYGNAERLVRNHQWDEGLAALAPLLKTEPRDVKALNLAGLAWIGKGDASQAEVYFKKAIIVDPKFSAALKNLSIVEFNSKQYVAAEEHLEAAESIAPDDAAIHLYLGEIFYQQKNFQRAVGEFIRIDSLPERSALSASHLAICYLRMNDQNKADEMIDRIPIEKLNPPAQFEMALALDDAGLAQRAIPMIDAVFAKYPDSYEIAFDRIMIQMDAKGYKQAIDGAKQLLAKGFDTSELNNVLAQAYEGNADFQLAFDAYRTAIKLAPDEEQNYVDLSSLCLTRHSYDTGLKVIEVGLTSNPGSGQLVFMRGLIHAAEDDFESAEADFRLSEDLTPQKDFGAIGLGATYLQKGHYDEAILSVRTKLREKPDDPSLLYLLGENLIRAGALRGDPRYAEAQAALEKSTRLGPGLCLPHVALGLIYLDEKRNAEAAEQFEKARNVDPSERSAYTHLAVAYKRSGQIDKAKEVLAVLKGMSDQEHVEELERMKAAAVDSAQKQVPVQASDSTGP